MANSNSPPPILGQWAVLIRIKVAIRATEFEAIRQKCCYPF